LHGLALSLVYPLKIVMVGQIGFDVGALGSIESGFKNHLRVTPSNRHRTGTVPDVDDGGPAHAELHSQGADGGATSDGLSDGIAVCLRGLGWSSHVRTSCPCPGLSYLCTFNDQVALKVCHCCQHLDHQGASGGGKVEIAQLQDHQTDTGIDEPA
jgi:hypothetical protein